MFVSNSTSHCAHSYYRAKIKGLVYNNYIVYENFNKLRPSLVWRGISINQICLFLLTDHSYISLVPIWLSVMTGRSTTKLHFFSDCLLNMIVTMTQWRNRNRLVARQNIRHLTIKHRPSLSPGETSLLPTTNQNVRFYLLKYMYFKNFDVKISSFPR